MIRPGTCVRPEQSASLHAIYQGRMCSCCGGVIPPEATGSSGPLILSMPNGATFPHRLCESCVALAGTEAAEVLQRVVTAVAIEGSA